MTDFFMKYSGILYLIQLFFAVIIGLYFWNLLKNQQVRKYAYSKESDSESLKLRQLRKIKLTEPLSSLTRPTDLNDVIGQSEAVEMLRSALCGPNPQHVLIYGPPGVGKTAAARLVLEEARLNPLSPFDNGAKFVEVDATITRFDERNIADPLIGSVHDPIYQGAGAMGVAGIPQPKLGACTKAHGGILFIDEIGELHPLQMNKLLKVLEDRKVLLESAYYSESNSNIPQHIHDIFRNGLPADFRLVGATTKNPNEIPPALRSRCLEIFFKPLDRHDLRIIVKNAVAKALFAIDQQALEEITRYASNGREAVNIVQLAVGIAQLDNKTNISLPVVEKVLNNGHFSPRNEVKLNDKPGVGIVKGLAVYGANSGVLLDVEANSISVAKGKGVRIITGVVDEEQLGSGDKKITRKSMARAALENVVTVLKSVYNLPINDYDIHVNFPGGIPVDGPSAGITMATAIYSSLTGRQIDNYVAMTGELSVYGQVKPVGGVMSKIEAARKTGIKKVIIPAENWLKIFDSFDDISIVAAENLYDVFNYAIIGSETEMLYKNMKPGIYPFSIS
jgi:Lon-like ATP-dependent protease